MEESTIKNDKDFDVTVTYKDGDEDKEVVVKAGEEVVVPTEVAEDVTTQIADATAPEEDPEDPKDPEEDLKEDDPKDPEADPKEDEEDEEDEDEDKDKALAKARLQNSELTIEKRFAELLSAGKVTPAQKDKILGLAKMEQGVQLSTEAGKKISLSAVIFDILEAGSKQFSTEENGSGKENEGDPQDGGDDPKEDKKPSESLSEAELAGFKAVGADPAKMDELAEKDPVFREALNQLSKAKAKKENK